MSHVQCIHSFSPLPSPHCDCYSLKHWRRAWQQPPRDLSMQHMGQRIAKLHYDNSDAFGRMRMQNSDRAAFLRAAGGGYAWPASVSWDPVTATRCCAAASTCSVAARSALLLATQPFSLVTHGSDFLASALICTTTSFWHRNSTYGCCHAPEASPKSAAINFQSSQPDLMYQLPWNRFQNRVPDSCVKTTFASLAGGV